MSKRSAVRTFFVLAGALCALQARAEFHLEEASIEGIHKAIQAGEVTCKQVVEGYVARAKAYNGVCTMPVTADGKKIPKVLGAMRAGAPVTFPTKTVALDKLVPDFSKYTGPTPDFGRMEPTASDASVYQQYGMTIGIPDAGQINALETLNLRGERSVTCKGKFDAPPGTPLPAGAPVPCEQFRRQPDAIEVAAALDAKYGRNPDLKAMPMYCAPISFKSIYDASDMRTTGGADVNYAMDAPPKDSTLVARLRSAGAIIYAHANQSEYNAGSGNPGGDAKSGRAYIGDVASRSGWRGTTCNPYDTERDTSGSSGGSGAAVAANLSVCSICETTGGSCRAPGTYNGVVTVVPTKGVISFAGSYGANPYQDRPGIMCRTMKDAVSVLDAFRDTASGTYFDGGDPFTALPRVIESKVPYANALVPPSTSQPLAGVRLGVIRALYVKDAPADAPISDGINGQLQVLRDLGAELVEDVDPRYPDDPSIPNMEFGFNDAFAEILPFFLPEIFSSQKDGKPEFAVPGWDVASRKYLVALASHQAPMPAGLDFRRVFMNGPAVPGEVTGYHFAFQMGQYLALRGDSRVNDWQTLLANSKPYNEDRKAALTNWSNKEMDPRTLALSTTVKRRDAVRMAMTKVLRQNRLDAFVNPVTTTLPGKIGGSGRPRGATSAFGGTFGYGAALGIPEVFVPAGYATSTVDGVFKLAADGKRYESVEGTTPVALPGIGLPFNIAFWAEPGQESNLIRIGSAYEAATRHFKAPPGFGRVKGEP